MNICILSLGLDDQSIILTVLQVGIHIREIIVISFPILLFLLIRVILF